MLQEGCQLLFEEYMQGKKKHPLTNIRKLLRSWQTFHSPLGKE